METSPLDIARKQVRELLALAAEFGGDADTVYRSLLKGQRKGGVSDADQDAIGYQIAALAEITGNAKYL